jgi:hypothetical protein
MILPVHERTRNGSPARSNPAVRLCFLHKFGRRLQTRNGHTQSMSLMGVKRTPVDALHRTCLLSGVKRTSVVAPFIFAVALGCITVVRGRSGPRSNFNEHKLTPRWPIRMATLRARFGSEAGWILSKDGLDLRPTTAMGHWKLL